MRTLVTQLSGDTVQASPINLHPLSSRNSPPFPEDKTHPPQLEPRHLCSSFSQTRAIPLALRPRVYSFARLSQPRPSFSSS